jgi:hypothetical protein
MLYRVHLAYAGFELTTLVVICTDCTGSCKSNYHTITTTTAPEITMTSLSEHINPYTKPIVLSKHRGRRGRDRMVVGFTTTCAISAYHH